MTFAQQSPEDNLQGGMSSSRVPEPAGMDPDIKALLQALPTRMDIETLILRLEETHRRDI